MLLLQVLLILLNAVFACAEIAVISVSDGKAASLASEGDRRAKKLVSLKSNPARFLATIQVAITLSGFLGSAFAAENFSDVLVKWLLSLGVTIPESTLDTLAVILITIILSYFTLVFGELVPKRLAMRRAQKLALGMSGTITVISKLFAPLVWLLTKSTNGILRLLGIDPNKSDTEVSEEDIRLMVDAGSEAGAIDSTEKELIQNVFEFDDLTAGEIATHRTEISLLWLDEDMDAWQNTINNSRHTLYPVCGSTVDDVVGILNAKDYFRIADKTRENVMKTAVKPAYFVPEGVKADVLFRNLKKTKNTLAVVLDEYGGMTGIVTINDLLQQLVGDFDESNGDGDYKPEIEAIDSETWKISGAVSLDDVCEATGAKLPCDEYDTFGGLVLSLLGTVPDDGAKAELDAFGLHIKITEVSDHRIKTTVVCLTK